MNNEALITVLYADIGYAFLNKEPIMCGTKTLEFHPNPLFIEDLEVFVELTGIFEGQILKANHIYTNIHFLAKYYDQYRTNPET